MDNTCNLQLFFLELQFFLFVKKFLAKYFFFLVEIDEDFEILVKFVRLFLLDNFLYLPIFCNLLPKLEFFLLSLCNYSFDLRIFFDSVGLDLSLL